MSARLCLRSAAMPTAAGAVALCGACRFDFGRAAGARLRRRSAARSQQAPTRPIRTLACPPAHYRSVLGGYASGRPVEPAPWTGRNDGVAPAPKDGALMRNHPIASRRIRRRRAAAVGLRVVFARRRHERDRRHRRQRPAQGRRRDPRRKTMLPPRARVVAHLLKRPLTADAAVQIALLNNRGLQAAYNELGIAEAVRVQQSLPPNPTISISRISGVGGNRDRAPDRRQHPGAGDAAGALRDRRRPLPAGAARAALETLRVGGGNAARLSTARSPRNSSSACSTQANAAAATTAQLAKRLGETGAMNKLDQAREQVFYAELAAQLATRAAARGERTRAADPRRSACGAAISTSSCRARLPRAAGARSTLPAVEQDAVRRRVDLQIARIELDSAGQVLRADQGHALRQRARRAATPTRSPTTRNRRARARARFHGARSKCRSSTSARRALREAEQTYMQAVNRLAEKAINVRSEAREAYRNYRSTYDIAGHYQREVLPLRKIISDEMMLRYGAMQIDVFALLTEARQQIAAQCRAPSKRCAISGSPAPICRRPSIGGGCDRQRAKHRSHRHARIRRRDRPLKRRGEQP